MNLRDDARPESSATTQQANIEKLCKKVVWRAMECIPISVARRIAPEMIEIIASRARILQRIRFMAPIGRRALAIELGVTERVLRTEIDALRTQGLLVAQPAGMSLSSDGQGLLDVLNEVLAALEGREQLGIALSRMLGISKVLVVPGDSDSDDSVKDALGYQAASYLRSALLPSDVLAVTGGTTLAAMAKMMPAGGEPLPIKVVPARGGLGETVSAQANTIASEIAQQIGGHSVMLHVPDRLSDDTLERLMQEPQIKERLTEIRQATVVVHGIGDAMKMARRRQLNLREFDALKEGGAVAEAFGYYFDASGNTVYVMTTAGLRLADLHNLRLVIGVAGGNTKAQAIVAAAKAYRMDVLVTDEGAAKQLVSVLRPSSKPITKQTE